jgi:hypothetical protein
VSALDSRSADVEFEVVSCVVLDLHALVWEGSALVLGSASRTQFYIRFNISLSDQTFLTQAVLFVIVLCVATSTPNRERLTGAALVS